MTYNANGSLTSGLPPVDSKTYHQGDAVTVLGNAGSMVYASGATFSGWNTAADGTGTTYLAPFGPATFTMGTSNVILYAVWVPYS